MLESLPIMLASCFMLWHAYYAQNYASIIDAGLPWMGHGKSQKRRRINKTQIVSHVQEDDSSSHTQTAGQRVSQSGRKINRPARYLQLTALWVSQVRKGKM